MYCLKIALTNSFVLILINKDKFNFKKVEIGAEFILQKTDKMVSKILYNNKKKKNTIHFLEELQC